MYVSKEDFIVGISSGLNVLHLGCVGFTDLDGEARVKSAKRSLHWKLTQCSKVVGVDRSRAVIEELRKLGIFDNVVVGDVERLDELPLNQKFDVVIAGDIIEHLSNPGQMLDGIKRFCRTDARVIITTPNAFGAPNYLRYSTGRFREGAEHVMSFNEQNLVTLLQRHGYAIAGSHTCFQPRSAEAHSSLAFRAGKSILKLFPRFGGTLMVVATPNAVGNGLGEPARA
jgi:2-polyprenyl-3-methyl-5-hydroxy-6-metoxy-1,4-benzoquinol methylase